ncbi:MAG TPA: S8 family serine peptidase [Acidimicrobiia bacterium]|nr:S8 family serine peptidase [Acidimicrobiia bacterium]
MSARRVVTALAVLAAVAATGSGPSAGAAEATKGLWAVTRDAHGDLHVVRGLTAAVATMDNRLGRDSAQVLSTEQDQTVRVLTTNDALRPQQWAFNAVNFESAWRLSTGAGIIAAVVDTGVRASHEDLAGSVLPGIDLAADAASVDPGHNGMVDPGGHGTHVAGIIAAHPNNGVGVAGAAPGVKILPVRVLDASGSGSSSDVADGIIWAADHGARVINLSLGGGPSPGMQVAIQYARSKQVVTFAAAGNSYLNGNQPTYPAAYPEAIAVGAIDQSLQHASFSNTGSYVDLAAPGDGIWSTYGSGNAQYALMSGTSMATPYATATGALVLGANPKLTAAQLTNALESTASDLGAPGHDSTFGSGLINPRGALLATSTEKINRGTKGNGYWIVTADGQVRTYGGARFYGDLRGKRLSASIVAASHTPDGKGYWLVGADGAVYSFGNAQYRGGLRGHRLNSPIVGMASAPRGMGYILLGRDGGVFAFGSAHFYGSTGGWKLNAPVRDVTMSSDGRGYWFVASDGGVFTFGNAKFHGSTGGMRLSRPVRSMTAAANGKGYWMVADDGGIFAFNVPFEGSLPRVRELFGYPYVSSVRMRSLPSNDGYYILGLNGSVWAFGNARFFGSLPGSWAVDLMQAP